MAGPSVVFGAIVKATNWTETAYGRVPSIPLPGENREDDTRFQKIHSFLKYCQSKHCSFRSSRIQSISIKVYFLGF